MKILVVDDSPIDRKLLRVQLEAEGVSVVEAADGVDALTMLSDSAIDGIVSDILMPRMDGYHLCREVRANERLYSTPFILCTDIYTSPGDEKFCVEVGADKFLKKPASVRIILDALRESRETPHRLVPALSGDEQVLMKEHNDRLVAKIEEKNAALEAAVNQLRMQSVALETTANAVIITDAAGKIKWVNPAFTTLTGYRMDEVADKTPRILKSGKQNKAFYAKFWKTILAGQTWRGEFVNRRKDGTIYHDEHTVTPVRDAGGKISHFIGVMQDVTERRGAEASLRLFRALIDRSHDGFEVIEPQTGRFLDINERFCEKHGYTREEMLAMTVFEVEGGVLDPTTWPKRVGELQRLSSMIVEGQHRRKNGSKFPVEVSLKYIRLDRDYIVAVVRDITERKRAETSLRESRQILEKAQQAGHVGSWVSDTQPTGKLDWSAETCRIFGIAPGEFDGRMETFLSMVHPDDRERVARASQAALAGDSTYSVEHRIVRRDGKTRWVHEQADLERDELGLPLRMVGVVQDITDRRQLEEQFRQSQKMEAIGQLAGGVAHDFNNILAATLMQVHLALLDINEPEKVRDGLLHIRSYAERAANLTRQLLLFSRRQVMQSIDLDLNEVVTHLTKMLQRIIGEDVRLQLNLHPAPLITHADAGMLDQILMNLSVNARDAMPGGGRLIIETAEKIVDEDMARMDPNARPGRYVWLSVSDSGTGIPPEVLPRIFEPFFTTKESGKGTGLGLATVFGIVQQHKGWLKVYSEVGHGTNFQVFLPASETTPEAAADKILQPEPRGGTETILLVEDDAPLRLLTRTHLERRGYKVLEAANGIEALRIWEKEADRVQLLLTDTVLPDGLSGHQIAQQFQEKKPGLKVILTSGYSPEIAGQDLVLKECQAFIQKPCATNQLLEMVRQCLDGRNSK